MAQVDAEVDVGLAVYSGKDVEVEVYSVRDVQLACCQCPTSQLSLTKQLSWPGLVRT